MKDNPEAPRKKSYKINKSETQLAKRNRRTEEKSLRFKCPMCGKEDWAIDRETSLSKCQNCKYETPNINKWLRK